MLRVKNPNLHQLLRSLSSSAAASETLQLDDPSYQLHRLPEPPPEIPLTKDESLLFLKEMFLIRKMETAMIHLYQQKDIRGFCHLYIGEEACAVGIKSTLRPIDSVITAYRCHAYPVLMDKDVRSGMKGVVAELLAKRTGNVRGKGGSMHMYLDRFFGGNGIVGAHVPLGTGIGLTHAYKKDGGVSFTILGDGAMNQGQVHEAFNFAKLHNLPVIYVIENNRYGLGTSVERSSANTEFYKRGDLIPGLRTSGMDVRNVRDAAKFAFDHVTSGQGPILLEFLTYRYTGHSMSDPGTSYRSREEVESVRDHQDPIKLLRQRILSSDFANEEELQALEKETKKLVDEVVKESQNDQHPPDEELVADVYKEYNSKIRLPALNTFQSHVRIGKGVGA